MEGTVAGFVNSIIILADASLQSLVGVLLTLHWSGFRSAAGVPVYSANDYAVALCVLPIGCLLAMIGVGFIRPGPRVGENNGK
jgi:hypothetical protein